jgi:coproporphyrinogen III oxidase-like Fe-S oxidoreductase
MIDEYIVNYDEYVGVGSGAFGYVNGAVYADTFALDDYFERIARGEFPLFAKKTFSFEERVQYYFMMKLFGMSLDIGEAERDFGGRFRSALWKELRLFKMAGAIREQNGIILPTRKGRYFWVIMMREFFTGVNNFRDLCRNGPKGK